jgi:hypothetical protein
MSFTQSYITDDEMCECPACGEYCLLDEDEIKNFKLGESVPITCYECNTIFYLEKDE